MSKPSSKFRKYLPYWISIFVVLVLFGVFIFRLFQWQIRDGAEYLAQANATGFVTVSLDAARGEILDRNGEALVYNRTAYKVVCRKPYMTADTMNDTIHTVVELLHSRGEKWNDELPIVLQKDGTYAFAENRENSIAYLKGKNFLNVNAYATAEVCVNRLVELYDVKAEQYEKAELLRLLSVRYNMTMQTFSTSMPYTLADSVSKETMAILEEHADTLPGVSIVVTTERAYPNGTLMPHLLGTVGKLTQEEYETLAARGYSYDDVVGKSGIESAMEQTLRGKDGVETLVTDSTGKVQETKITEEPVQGNTVVTTIDSKLQQAVQYSLEKNVKAASAEASGKYTGEDCIAGAAVVLDVSDFSVLAAGTYPTYDLSKLTTDSDYYTELAEDETTPLFNRALYGAFTPGSVFKPCVAAAALQEGVINADSKVVCEHWYTYYAPSFMPTCMGTHGPTTVTAALRDSCNVFFFDVGRRLGIENMGLYASSFGLGEETGIEIGESSGILASPEERVAAGGTWQPGDVIQAAIGQSDNAFTPLQLATYCATIANNGVRLQPHIVKKVVSYDRTETISETKAEEVEKVSVSQKNLNLVKSGMRQVITSGTASSVFADYGIAIAGKTGTAEVPGHSDNETFIGFAPYDNPKIAIAVVIQYGARSTYSLGVAKDIFDAYFYGKIVDENGNPIASAISNATDALQMGAELLTP